MSSETELVVGTYEEFLVGYKIQKKNDTVNLVQSFATHAHTGSVKSVSAAGAFLVSGGADDKIIIHDMKSRSESRTLLNHNGTVHAVAFTTDATHLLSGGSDGVLCATRTGNWQIEKNWPKAHKGSAVTCISVHPSNKLALTIGDDKTLRTWNLIKGRQAYVTNLASKGTASPLSVVWSPEGQHFSLTGYNDVSVWSIANAGIERILKCKSKSICMVWISETLTAVGLENGEIVLFDLESESNYEFKAHSQRVKGIAFEDPYLYSASSSGEIKAWRFDREDMTFEEEKCVNAGCRITCLTLVKAIQVKIENDDRVVEPSFEVVEEVDSDAPSVSKKKKNAPAVGVKSQQSPGGKLNPKSKKNKFMPYVSVTTDDNNQNKKSHKKQERRRKFPHQKRQKQKSPIGKRKKGNNKK